MSTYKASFFNYLFNSINALVVIINGIVMVPIYFHYMSVSTYGAWLATGNVVSMLGLVESGFSSVITQKMAVTITNNDNKKFLKLAGANLITAALFSSIILVVGLLISPFVAGWVNAETSDFYAIKLAFVIALVASCISIIVSLIGAFPQVWQETKNVGIINTVSNITAIVSLVLFLLFGFGVVSIALSYLVRACLNLFFQGLWIFNHWRKKGLDKPLFDKSTVFNLFRACLYPFLSKLSGIFMGHSQSFIIAYFMNPALAAIYDITTKVCNVACTFVSQTNGSFFALFSLTMASNEKSRINDVLRKTSSFFFVSLFSVALYSMCFSEPIINYWVGLDKYGGVLLLSVAVFASTTGQIRRYFNNIIYTGGLINKSAKLDIICMFAYLIILLSIIKYTQIYAVPIAGAVSSIVFLFWYMKIMRNSLQIDVTALMKILLSSMFIITPFLFIHFVLEISYAKLLPYLVYFISFTVIYCGVVFWTNRDMVKMIIQRIYR